MNDTHNTPPADADASSSPRRVALFVTCLVDLYRPSTGFAAVQLLEAAGYEVEVPAEQTCCGQIAFNSGDEETARAIARQVIERFEEFERVIVPSGSCAGMLTRHFPELFAGDPAWRTRAERLAERVLELTTFLASPEAAPALARHLEQVRPPDGVRVVTWHDSCSGLRELGVRAQPRQLLSGIAGLELAEMRESEACCGFGGTFCVKYPGISGRMVEEKTANAADTGADAVLAADLGCLLNIAGRARREARPLRAFHVAEVLAGTAERAIGEEETPANAAPGGAR